MLTGLVANLTPQGAQHPVGLAHVPGGVGRDLEHGLHQLRLELAVRRLLDQLVDGVDQRVRAAIEDHQLLLDADRIRGAGEIRLHRWPRTVKRELTTRRGANAMALGYDGKLYI